MRIWNVARSQAEIQASMNSEILVPTAGLIGRWGLNDTSGTTASNLNRLGVTAFTLESWVKRDVGGATMTTGTNGFDGNGGRPAGLYPVLAKGMGEGETPANVNTNYIMGITSDGFVGVDFEDTAGGANHPAWGTTSIPTGSWHHIAATYTGSCWALYVDGSPDPLNGLVSQCPNATPESTSYQRAGLSAGINSSGSLGTGFFKGTIDEARVWNRALDASEILANKNLELTSGTGLVARWGLNEGSGTTVNSSVGSFPGTLTNGPVWVTTDLTPPAAPTGLSATGGTRLVNLTWTANTEPDLAGYNLYRGTTTGGPYTKVNTPVITSASYSDTGLTNGTPYYYVLRAVDTSSNESGNSTEAVATPAEAATGLNFDGTNDYVTFGNVAGLGLTDFTIETWFYWTGGGDTVSTGSGGLEGANVAIPLVSKGRGEGDGSNVDMNYFFGLSNGKLAADFEEDETGPNADGLNHPVIGNATVSTNTWHHAAVTYDGQVWKLYLDGNLDKTLDLGTTLWPRDDSIQHAGIATAMTSTGATDGFFQGKIDEVRMWDYARDISEIRGTVNSQLTSGTGLVARWGMEEGGGTTINSSVGTFAGTLTNGPTWATPGAPFNLSFDGIPPAAPTGLFAIGANRSVALDWNDNTEPDLAGYNVYRGTTPNVYAKINASLVTTSAYSDTGLTNGTEYYYVVRAVDTGGNESGASNEAYSIPQLEAGSALSFTSDSGTYVTFGDPDKLDLATFTIETWFKRTGAGTSITTGGSGIANAIPLVTHGAQQSEGGTVDANWMLVIDDSTDVIAADFEDMATGLNHPVLGVTPITDNTWHHAAATYDGTTWKLYLDGKLENTVAANAAPRSDTTQQAALGTMLNTTGGMNGFFRGVLDESRVWNRALTQTEILTNLNHQVTSGSGLVARWGLNEGTGTTVGDSVATAANGTITGSNFAWVPGAPFDLNLAPETPTLVSPADTAANIPTSTPLTVHVSDARSSDLTVSFYGREMGASGGQDFTLIAIPDPQYYASTYPSIYNAQMNWVVSEKTSRNIKYVMSLGDNVNTAATLSEWTTATTAWDILTAGRCALRAGPRQP